MHGALAVVVFSAQKDEVAVTCLHSKVARSDKI
jgi:hypothetical protein